MHSSCLPPPHPALAAVLVGVFTLCQQGAMAAEACSARSSATTAPVVELYTSEGCSSCPPADRWLSTLKADPSVVALAFHVDYWDRLGWKDRFSSASFTERQAREQATDGARFSYTPQVVVGGRDSRDWPSTAALDAQRPAATVALAMARQGDHVTATVVTGAQTPKRLAAYWAVTEQGHVSNVQAGENQGSTLHHDFVVRDYRTVPAWPSTEPSRSIGFDLSGSADAAHPRQVNLVVVDADTGRPLQALKLGC